MGTIEKEAKMFYNNMDKKTMAKFNPLRADWIILETSHNKKLYDERKEALKGQE